jgi:hypothetical protein
MDVRRSVRIIENSISTPRPSGLHHHLDAAVLLALEGLVQLRRIIESGAMGDEERRIDRSILSG